MGTGPMHDVSRTISRQIQLINKLALLPCSLFRSISSLSFPWKLFARPREYRFGFFRDKIQRKLSLSPSRKRAAFPEALSSSRQRFLAFANANGALSERQWVDEEGETPASGRLTTATTAWGFWLIVKPASRVGDRKELAELPFPIKCVYN